jgi:hypothetical protein
MAAAEAARARRPGRRHARGLPHRRMAHHGDHSQARSGPGSGSRHDFVADAWLQALGVVSVVLDWGCGASALFSGGCRGGCRGGVRGRAGGWRCRADRAGRVRSGRRSGRTGSSDGRGRARSWERRGRARPRGLPGTGRRRVEADKDDADVASQDAPDAEADRDQGAPGAEPPPSSCPPPRSSSWPPIGPGPTARGLRR